MIQMNIMPQSSGQNSMDVVGCECRRTDTIRHVTAWLVWKYTKCNVTSQNRLNIKRCESRKFYGTINIHSERYWNREHFTEFGTFATTCSNIQNIYKLTDFIEEYLLILAAAAPPYLTSINQLCLHERRITHRKFTSKCVAYNKEEKYVEIKCQLDATEDFIADLIACSTCFGHTMPIIRSSRVLYSGCCVWYFVLWFSK